MKTELQVLSEQELLGKKFKIYGTYEEPLFLAKDVAEWIGHSQVSKMLDTVDDEEKLMGTLFLSGQKRNLWMLKENGVYEVIMQSRKPIAKTVKKQFKAILHSVRVHGGYLAGQETMSPEQIMAQGFLAAQSIIDEKNKLIAGLEPKGAYYDKILRCKGLINTTVIAKDYGMSARSFNKMLHEYGIQYKQDRQWLLYAKYQNKGYTGSQTTDIEIEGDSFAVIDTKWTQKGRAFLYSFLKKKGIVPTMERLDLFPDVEPSRPVLIQEVM